MLRRPDDFFAAGSDWHTETLAIAGASFQRESLPCHKKLPIESVAAEVSRNVRWAFNTARQTFATLHQFLDSDALWELCNWQNIKRPGRLQKFSDSELGAAFAAIRLPAAEGVPAFALAA
jgi:phage replication initiation protein